MHTYIKARLFNARLAPGEEAARGRTRVMHSPSLSLYIYICIIYIYMYYICIIYIYIYVDIRTMCNISFQQPTFQ